MENVIQFRKPWAGLFCIILALVLCGPGSTLAALEDCSISGVDRVYVDTNNNHQPDAGDAYWTLQVDKTEKVGLVTGHGIWPDPVEQPGYPEAFLFNYTQTGDSFTIQERAEFETWVTTNLEHPEFMLKIIATKVNGSTNFNRLSFEYLFPGDTCSQDPEFTTVDMLDADNNGVPDTLEGTVSVQNGPVCPKAVVDHSFETRQIGGQNYWVIPGMVKVWGYEGSFHREGPFDVFVPLGENCIDVTCGDEKMVEQCSTAAADNRPTHVSSLTPWGTIFLVFVILMVGTWIARKGGFGRGLYRD